MAPRNTSTKPAASVMRHLWWLAPIVLTTLVYLPVLGFDFHEQENHLVAGNAGLASWDPALLFLSDFDRGLADKPRAYWRPLANVSLKVDALLFGLRPGGFYAVNLSLHLLATALLALLARRLSGNPFAALLAGLLFGLHPLLSSVVCEISRRADLLAAVFLLAAILAYQKCLRDRAGTWPYRFSLLAFFLGLLCKEAVILLPLLVLVLELQAGGREASSTEEGSPPSWVDRVRPFLAVALVYAFVRVSALGITTSAQGWHGGSASAHVLRAARAQLLQGRFLLLPLGAPLLVGDGRAEALSAEHGLGALLLLLFVTALFLVGRRKGMRPAAVTAASMTLLPWITVSNLPVPIRSLLEPGYMYLPALGATLTAALLAAWLASSLRKRQLISVVCAPLLVMMAYELHTKLGAYETPVTFESACARRRIDSGRPAYWASQWYTRKGAAAPALEMATRSIARKGPLRAHLLAARALLRLGRGERALARLRSYLEKRPDNPEAAAIGADILYARKDPVTAVRLLRSALAKGPPTMDLLSRLARALLQARLYPDALEVYERMEKLAPGLPMTSYNKGVVLLRSGDIEKAVLTLRKVVDTGWPKAVPTLMAALTLTGKASEAVALASAQAGQDAVAFDRLVGSAGLVLRRRKAWRSIGALLAASYDRTRDLRYLDFAAKALVTGKLPGVAVEILRKGFRENPKSLTIRLKLITLYAHLKKWHLARRHCQEYLKQRPGNQRVRKLMAGIDDRIRRGTAGPPSPGR